MDTDGNGSLTPEEFARGYISLYLPISPYSSLYLPISPIYLPHISLTPEEFARGLETLD